jgi:hypothetical protein
MGICQATLEQKRTPFPRSTPQTLSRCITPRCVLGHHSSQDGSDRYLITNKPFIVASALVLEVLACTYYTY